MKIPYPLSTWDGKVTTQEPHEVWVRGGDFPTNVARKITEAVEEHGHSLIAAIGADAINQAMKGLAIARDMWRLMDGHEHQDLGCVPYFSTIIDSNGNQRTRLMFPIYTMDDPDVSDPDSQ